MSAEDNTIKFKSTKKRQVRRRQSSSSSEEEVEADFNKEDYERTRELQKLRKKTGGTNVITLISGKKISKLEEAIVEDPFKLKTGGLVDMKSMKGDYTESTNAYEVGTQFSKETHIRDEDDEMRKFIETEMEKLKGRQEEVEDADAGNRYLSPEDAALLSLPEHLRKSTFKKDQQMLSAQMLSGIPEVDLGIEAKIQNIERTEQAKRKLIEDAKRKEVDHGSQAKRFMQHDRFEREKPTSLGREKSTSVQSKEGKEDGAGQNLLKGRAHDESARERFKQNSQSKR